MKKCCPTKDFFPIFRALGDSNRHKIFSFLCTCSQKGSEEVNVKEVSTCCDVDLSGVSRHLSTLKEAGILLAEKRGKEVYYSVNKKELAAKLRELADELDQ